MNPSTLQWYSAVLVLRPLAAAKLAAFTRPQLQFARLTFSYVQGDSLSDPRDLRTRQRIRIELLARIRQISGSRSNSEITRTLDVSRNGLLFRTRESYDAAKPVWVTMPFVENALAQDLEFPASVVRMLPQRDGSHEIALQFHSAHADRFRSSYQAEPPPPSHTVQKRRPRVKMTLPIRVRAQKAAEESVTLDVSRTGVLFRTERTYSAGDPVMVCMPYQPAGRLEEVAAIVVRTVERADVRGVALHYAAAIAEPDAAAAPPPSGFYAN